MTPLAGEGVVSTHLPTFLPERGRESQGLKAALHQGTSGPKPPLIHILQRSFLICCYILKSTVVPHPRQNYVANVFHATR